MDYKYIPILLFGLLSLVLGFKTTMLLRLGFLTYNNSSSYMYIAFAFAVIYYFMGLYSTLVSLLSVLMVEGILRRKLIKSYLFIVTDFYKILRDNAKKEDTESKEVDFVQNVSNQLFEFIDNTNVLYVHVIDTLKKSVMLYYMFQVYMWVNNLYKSNELKQFLTDLDNNIGFCVKGLHDLVMQIPFVNSLSKEKWNTELKNTVVKKEEELDEYETIDMDDINNNEDNNEERKEMINIDEMLTSVLQNNELPNMNDMVKDMMKMKREGKMPVFNPENLVNQLDQLTQMVTKMEDLQKSMDLKQD